MRSPWRSWSPAQRYDLRGLLVGPSVAPDHEVDDEPLTLVGFQLHGARIEPKTFVGLEPGGVTVLFGRNGAGKTLVLDAVSSALQSLQDDVDNARAGVEGAACDVVLRAGTQDAADRLFRLIFAHIGWSPLANLDPITQLELNQLLPSWSALTERPSDAEGLSPDELVAQPLAVMRSALVDAIVATSSWGSGEHVRRLTEAILSSPLIVWHHDGSIALAVKTSDLDDSLRVPAQTLLAQIPTMGDVALRPPLDMALLSVSRSLTGGEPKNVVVLNPTPVLTPGTAPRTGLNISAESPWLRLGVQLWTAVRSAAPIDVRFDPSLPSDKSTSDLAEQAIIRLLARIRT
jgi:hypothetical protein